MKCRFLVAIVVFAAVALQACGGQPAATSNNSGATQPQAASAPVEATVVPAVPTASKTGPLDPAAAAGDAVTQAVSRIYEGLVRVENGQPALALASGVVVSGDGLEYTISLRPAVKFHDGTAFNADAVLANFDRWFDPKNPLHGVGTYDAWVANFGGFKDETKADGKPKATYDGVEKINDLNVLVHLNAPDPDFFKKLSLPAFSIVSPAALKAAGFGTKSGVDGGTGMYKMAAWDGTTLKLEPFAGYWNTAAIPTGNLDFTLGQ